MLMCKNTKSILAKHLKASIEPVSSITCENSYYVLDGGHLLQSIRWPVKFAYAVVYSTYVRHMLQNCDRLQYLL